MATIICPKCGTANQEGSRFCEQCGAMLPAAQKTAAFAGPGPVAVKKNSGKKWIIPLIAVLVLALGGGAFAIMHFSKQKELTEIDLVADFDDRVLQYEGQDGEGVITGIDLDRVKENLAYNDQSDEVKDFIDSVKYRTDKDDEQDLSNGEKVKVICEYDKEKAEEKGLKVKNGKDGVVETTITLKSLAAREPEVVQSDNSSSEPQASNYPSSAYGSELEQAFRADDDETVMQIISGQYLVDEDIDDLNEHEIQKLANYFYAMHGYKLNDKAEGAKFFKTRSWYNPTTKDQDVAASEFNDYEFANEKLVGARRDYLRAHSDD